MIKKNSKYNLTVNHGVPGSSPGEGAKKEKASQQCGAFLCLHAWGNFIFRQNKLN